MKGLIIKDLRIILNNNKTFLLMMLVVTVIMITTMEDSSFVIGYISVVGAMLALGTISYDEYDNGMAFLFTLPVTRKMYVQSKYLFSFGYSVLLCISVDIISILAGLVKGNTPDISMPIGMIAGCLLFLFIMIPIQLKFGAEKSRIALLIIFGGFMAIVAFAVLIAARFGVFTEDLEVLIDPYQNIVVIVGIILAAVLGVFSYRCSIKIMEKKEY